MELKKYKLGEIAEITSSKRIFESEYCEYGIPFIRGQEISNESIASTTSKFECYISEERYNELKSKYGVPHKNDILITAVGTIGNVYLVEDNKKFYFKDGNIIWFKNIKNIVYPEFLLYFMKSPIFKQQINRSLIGAVQKALTIMMLAEIQISLPPLSDQKRIASILSAYERKIALNRAINQNLEAIAKQLYDYWFVQFDFPNEEGKPYKSSGGKMVWNEKLKREIPEGWETLNIGTILDKVVSTPRLSTDEYLSNGIYPIIDQTLGGYYAGFTNRKDAVVNQYPAVVFGDHSCAVKYINFPFVRGADGTQVMLSSKSNISVEYLYFCIKNIQISKGYARHYSFLKEQLIIAPSEKIAREFEKVVTNIFKQITQRREENQSLTKQRNELLPLLMNGQVTIE